ncbi:coenzyme Q biosynthesis protein Coq4-domain-containing protein, partial [Jimgerdemannia flammicorona]
PPCLPFFLDDDDSPPCAADFGGFFAFSVPLSLAGAPPRSEPHSITLTFSGAAEYVTPSSSQRKKLYETHIPIPLRQKVFLAAGSAVTALSNPLRGDMVATLGETTGHLFLERMRDRMLEDPMGRRILRERPVVNSQTIDLDRLRALPNRTFGREYTRWLDTQGVSPDTREPVRYVDSDELAYVMRRYRESHDFAHTLTGLGVTVESELALKWFEWAQMGLPMTALASLFGPLRLTSEERNRLFTRYVPWAVQCAVGSKFLMNVYFEKWFEKPLEEVRRELGIYLPEVPENDGFSPAL